MKKEKIIPQIILGVFGAVLIFFFLNYLESQVPTLLKWSIIILGGVLFSLILSALFGWMDTHQVKAIIIISGIVVIIIIVIALSYTEEARSCGAELSDTQITLIDTQTTLRYTQEDLAICQGEIVGEWEYIKYSLDIYPIFYLGILIMILAIIGLFNISWWLIKKIL